MELIKKVYTNKEREYLGSDGKKHTMKQEMYFLVFDNGIRIAVKPVFANDWSSFAKMYTRKFVTKDNTDIKNDKELPF